MIQDNLHLLFKLYYRPIAALGAIIDEGSLLFAAIAVLLVSVGLNFATGSHLGQVYQEMRAASVAAAGHAAPAPAAQGEDEDELQAAPPVMGYVRWAVVSFSSQSVLLSAATLALLYAPATLFLVTLVEPVGSFGVAFRRDFGPLLACTLMAWTAARLPFAIAAAVVPAGHVGSLAVLALWVADTVYLGVLMVLTLRTVFGARLAPALGVVAISWLATALQHYLVYLASPFALYWAYVYFSGDVGDVAWSFGARQSFKRYLEASTLNPRDANAHYQLGLVHQRRRQLAEATDRFGRAVAIDPNEIDAHYQLGRIARSQQKYVEAIAHFENVVARDERHSRHEIWREIGATYLESGSLEHARWALDKYVAQREHDPEGLYLLGDTLRRLGEIEAARHAFARCIESVDTTPGYRLYEVKRWRKLARTALEA